MVDSGKHKNDGRSDQGFNNSFIKHLIFKLCISLIKKLNFKKLNNKPG